MQSKTLNKFSIAARENISGKNVVVIEAKPRKKQKKNPNYGRFWIDIEDFSVMKFVVEQESLAGFERPVNPRLKPQYIISHYYNFKKNGLRFPSKTSFEENYLFRGSIRQKPIKVTETTTNFSNYKFFQVDVDVEIRRKPY